MTAIRRHSSPLGNNVTNGNGWAAQPANKRSLDLDHHKLPALPIPNRTARTPGRLAAVTWLKCTAHGVCTTVTANRQKLVNQLGVQTRDLRILDPHLSSSYPSAILCRGKAFVVNLEHIKCIVTADYVLVLNADDEVVLTFIEKLKTKLTAAATASAAAAADGGVAAAKHDDGGGWHAAVRQHVHDAAVVDELPFELHVLELCLEEVCHTLEREVTDLEGATQIALDALTQQVSAVNLERERRMKNRLNRLRVKVETVKEVLEKYLDNNDDMNDLHLTAKREAERRAFEAAVAEYEAQQHAAAAAATTDVIDDAESVASSSSSSSSSSSASTSSSAGDHEIVEVLLETYFMSVDNTWNRIAQLSENIDDAEDYVNIELDSHRNTLISIQMLFVGFTTVLALMMAVGTLFGMNLNSNLQTSYPVFLEVWIITTVMSVLLFAAFYWYCWYRKLLFF